MYDAQALICQAQWFDKANQQSYHYDNNQR